METNETMVEQNDDTSAVDTLDEEGMVEEQDESESVESFLEGEEPTTPTEEEPKKPESQGSSEPGWFKKRWDREVGKLSTQIRNEVRAEYEGVIAPMRERLLEMDAQELVRKGEVKNLEIAKELVRARQGLPAVAPAAQSVEQPRQANGQFAPKQEAPSTSSDSHLTLLKRQAERIRASGGPDVVHEFLNNEEVKRKVVAGEMDFYEVAEMMKETPQKKPPAPTRSPNGVTGGQKSSIATMSKEQFEKFEKSLSAGKRYRV